MPQDSDVSIPPTSIHLVGPENQPQGAFCEISTECHPLGLLEFLFAFQQELRATANKIATGKLLLNDQDIYRIITKFLEDTCTLLQSDGMTIYTCDNGDVYPKISRLYAFTEHEKTCGEEEDHIADALKLVLPGDMSSFVGASVNYAFEKSGRGNLPTSFLRSGAAKIPYIVGGPEQYFFVVQDVNDSNLPPQLRRTMEDRSLKKPGSMLIFVIWPSYASCGIVFQILRWPSDGASPMPRPFSDSHQELFVSLVAGLADFFLGNLNHVSMQSSVLPQVLPSSVESPSAQSTGSLSLPGEMGFEDKFKLALQLFGPFDSSGVLRQVEQFLQLNVR